VKKEIFDNELDNVVGGTVIISRDYMIVGFSTTREKFNLVNVSYKDARNFVEDLLDEHRDMSNAEFDAFCKETLFANGWITPYNP